MTHSCFTFALATYGTLVLLYQAFRVVDWIAERVQLRIAERRRREPVQMVTMPRAVAVPTVYRREHPEHWPTSSTTAHLARSKEAAS